ncbi:hypothetical protein ACTXT7_015051 [Hymenolepis weldensis]
MTGLTNAFHFFSSKGRESVYVYGERLYNIITRSQYVLLHLTDGKFLESQDDIIPNNLNGTVMFDGIILHKHPRNIPE